MACSSAPVIPEPTLGVVPTITLPNQVQGVIDQVLPDAKMLIDLAYAEQALKTKCVNEHGVTGAFSFVPAGGNDSGATVAAFVRGLSSDRVKRSELWGFFDPDSASQYGYRVAPTEPGGLNEKSPDGTSPDVMRQCTESARTAFGGKDWSSYASPHRLPGGGPVEASKDSRWIAAAGRWSQCMKEAGYSYQFPTDAIGDSRWRSGGEAASVSSAQIAAATADVRCKVSTNLVGVGVAVQSAYDKQYLDSNGPAVQAYVAGYRRLAEKTGS